MNGGSLRTSGVIGPGSTASINSDSKPSYSSARASAGVQASSWKYVRDTGSGAKSASGL